MVGAGMGRGNKRPRARSLYLFGLDWGLYKPDCGLTQLWTL